MGNTNQWNTKPRGRAVDMRAEARHERAVQTKGYASARACFSRSRFSPLIHLRLSPFLCRSTTPRSSLPRSHSHSLLFLVRFFLSRVYTRARTNACTRNMRDVFARASGRTAPSSSSSSAPLGRAHKSEGKERGHGIFQDGIFNALARSVTPGKPGPRDWPATLRIPGPSLAEPGPRPTPMPSVLPHTHHVLRAAAPSSRTEPSCAVPRHAMPLVRVLCVSAYACSVGHAIRHSVVRRAEVAARCNEEPSRGAR